MKHFKVAGFFISFTVCFIISCHPANNNDTTTDAVTTPIVPIQLSPSDLIAQVKEEMDSINKIDATHFTTFQDIIKTAQQFDQAYAYKFDDKSYPDSVRSLLKQEKVLLINKQIAIFPLLRKAYVDSVAKASLKYGVIVTGSGTKIGAAGAIYASEDTMHNIQNGIGMEIGMLRFKGITYRLHKEDKAFTYFPIPSRKDDELH
jgi:hypothetical protein